MIRRVAAGLLFAALLAGGMRASILRLLLPPHRPPDRPAPPGGIDRKPLRFANDPVPADVLRFLEEVRARTREGERIGLLLGAPHDGFSYTYWRASYVLAGRTVLLPMNLVAPDRADVVAIWNTGWGDPRYELVWTVGHGAVARRKR